MAAQRHCGFALLLGALLLLFALPAASAPVSPAALRYRGYVNDFAEVIEPEWEQRLTRLVTQLDQKTKAQIAVVTLRSLEGEPIEDFATRLFEVWGIGHKDDRGALLLLVIQERKSRLEVGYGLEPIVPDGYAGNVLREMRPALRQQKYGEAIYAGVSLLAQRIASASGVTLEGAAAPPASAAPPATGAGNPWVALAFLAVILVFVVLAWLGKGMPLGPSYRRRSYVRSSGFGGFGGYDSGGSGGGFGGFGGFGGGRSGGGGASSGW